MVQRVDYNIVYFVCLYEYQYGIVNILQIIIYEAIYFSRVDNPRQSTLALYYP